MAERTKEKVEIWDRCECGTVLHSILEAKRGVCARCWWRNAPSDTKAAMRRLLASAFNGATDDQRDAAVADAMDKLKRDETPPGDGVCQTTSTP